jgi:hypothetical protein
MIDTTLNLRNHVREALDRAVKMTGRPLSQIVIFAMKRGLRNYGSMIRDGGRVRYQARGRDKNWKKTHIVIEQRDYEVFLDMRKLFKCSVSLLVSVTVDKHLDDLVEAILGGEYDEDADNYPFQSYVMAHRMAGDVPCWLIYWGMPPKKELRLLFQVS